MAKTKISEFSSTPANNTDIDSINIAEGCAPSGINDAIRELMSQLKDFQTGAVGDSFNGPVGTSTAAAGAFTTLSASGTLGVTGVATLGAGAILNTPASVTLTNATGLPLTTGTTGTLPATNGGTGQFSYAVGDLVYASTTTALSKLADVATGNALISGGVGVAPSYGKISLTTHVSGTLPTANGGTNLTSFTANGVVYASSSSALATGSALTFDGTNLGLGVSAANYANYKNFAIGATTGANIDLISGSTIVGNIYNTSTDLVIQNSTSGPMRFSIGGSEQMRLTSTGLGIGTSSPNISSVAKALTVNGTDAILEISNSNTLRASLYGNSSGGALSGVGSLGLRFFTSSSGATTERMVIDSSGNVGIGTSSPAVKLDVLYSDSTFAAGINVKNSNASSSSQAKVYVTNNSNDYLALVRNSSGLGSGSSLFSTGAYPLSFFTDSTERMRIDSSGNVGIGVTPSAWGAGSSMDVGAQTSVHFSSSVGTLFGKNVYFNSGYKYRATSTARAYVQDDSGHLWLTAPSGTAGNAITFTQAMTLDASGNLGVGTTSPSSYQLGGKFAVASSTSGFYFNDANNRLVLDGAGTNRDLTFYFRYSNSATITSDSNLIFQTGSTPAERARITSSGDFLVGTTNIGYSRKLGVDASSDCAMFKTSSASGNPAEMWNSATAGENRFIFFYTEASPTTRGSIDYNRGGGVTRYNTSSDATLKNINGDAPKQVSVDILNSTKIREYSWKDDANNKPQIGVIAQELHETFKGAVSVGGDKVSVDEEGNETTQYVPWSVDKTAFTFHLIAGWQEHQRIIQEQQAIIESLKSRLDAANL